MLKSIACMNVPAFSGVSDDTIFIVSGLPRSGTSMLMRMLAFGGIEPLTDDLRKRDFLNPHGYFEWEPIKERQGYVEWIDDAVGKSLKVVSRFLHHLPATHCYSVLFLHRDLDEVARSQSSMAKHHSDLMWDAKSVFKLRDIYRRHVDDALDWIDRRPNMRLHQVRYEDLLANTEREVGRICEFISPRQLLAKEMLLAIDPTLNHSSPSKGHAHAQA
jgi:hypothetical protein